MNNIVVFFITAILISNYCKAQHSFEISLGIGNPSQFQKPFDDFYLHNLNVSTKPNLYSAGIYSGNSLKYTLNAAIDFNKKYKLQLGYSLLNFNKEKEPESTSFANSPFISEEYSQQITEWSFAFSKIIHFEKFSFNFGFEVPIFIANEFKYSSLNKPALFETASSSGSYYFYANINETLSIPGGTILGLNNKISIQYSILKWLYIYAGGKYGLLKTDLGGRSNYSYSYSNSNLSGNGFVYDHTEYKTTYISSPSMEFGLGFSFE